MNRSNLFSAATGVIWQDFKGFKRSEKDCKFNEIFHWTDSAIDKLDNPIIALLCIALIPLIFAFMILWWFLGPLSAAINRNSISNNAYDIELTPHQYKLTRNKKEKIGVCYWLNWYNCKMLLTLNFDSIVRFDEETFVINKNGKFGLYNAKKDKIVVSCKNSSFFIDGAFVTFDSNGKKQKFNKYGERIMI